MVALMAERMVDKWAVVMVEWRAEQLAERTVGMMVVL